MSRYCCNGCWNKWVTCCPCDLSVVAHITGWLGIVGRIILISVFSAILANLTDYDPSLYTVTVATCLTHALATFIINALFIYGIFMRKKMFLLPYIAALAFEMAIGCIIAMGIIMLFFAIGSIAFGFYLIFIVILLTGVNFLLWTYSILFYKDLEYEGKVVRSQNIGLTETP